MEKLNNAKNGRNLADKASEWEDNRKRYSDTPYDSKKADSRKWEPYDSQKANSRKWTTSKATPTPVEESVGIKILMLIIFFVLFYITMNFVKGLFPSNNNAINSPPTVQKQTLLKEYQRNIAQ